MRIPGLLSTGIAVAVAISVPGTAAASPFEISASVEQSKVRPRLVAQGPEGIRRPDGSAVTPGDLTLPPGFAPGVGDLILFNTDDSGGVTSAARCTGSRIGAQKVLTAAHCLETELDGDPDFENALVDFPVGVNQDGEAVFERHFVSLIREGAQHPGFNGNLLEGNDVAVLDLATTPSETVTTHDIFRAGTARGSEFDIVGFGQSGTGDSGATPPSGAQRFGTNRFSQFFFNFGGDPNSVLWFDFDNGNPANDAFGRLGDLLGIPGLDGLGTGPLEVNSGPGDSGGPSFVDGKIAAVTSFGLTSNAITVGGESVGADVDNSTNSSFGEFSGNARIATAQEFIDRRVVPAPATGLIFGLGLAGLIGLRLRRREAA